jgi:thermitase
LQDLSSSIFCGLLNKKVNQGGFMISKIITASLLMSIPVMSAEYLVKIKNGKSFTNKSVETKSQFATSFGQFAVIEADSNQAKSLSHSQELEYIEPNYIYSITSVDVINDAEYEEQWGLKNTGKNSGGWFSRGVEGMDIKAEKAWTITKGSKDIKIAVIDTGVDYNHEDLKANIMVNELELNGTAGVDDDGNGYIDDTYGYDFANNDNDPMDGHGHGTHCAGVIGALHNSIGIRGVMADVQILPIQFLTKTGRGTLEGAIKAIDYAISRGVHIMSNSWGGTGASIALTEAVERAESAGILFIAAAGNSRSDNDTRPTMPANIKTESIISVGAMDGKGKRASFSNYGKETVHVFAPGNKIYSTVQNNGYKDMSGTSMACPMVAGVAGLILSSEPNLTPVEVKQRLMSTAGPGEELSTVSASGLVNAYQSLK